MKRPAASVSFLQKRLRPREDCATRLTTPRTVPSVLHGARVHHLGSASRAASMTPFCIAIFSRSSNSGPKIKQGTGSHGGARLMKLAYGAPWCRSSTGLLSDRASHWGRCLEGECERNTPVRSRIGMPGKCTLSRFAYFGGAHGANNGAVASRRTARRPASRAPQTHWEKWGSEGLP